MYLTFESLKMFKRVHAVLVGMRPKTTKPRIIVIMDSEPLTRKYVAGSKMRYRHSSSTPAQSCARGWLQQSVKAASKREKSEASFDSAEHEQSRPKVKAGDDM